jgi:hypothetical protein
MSVSSPRCAPIHQVLAANRQPVLLGRSARRRFSKPQSVLGHLLPMSDFQFFKTLLCFARRSSIASVIPFQAAAERCRCALLSFWASFALPRPLLLPDGCYARSNLSAATSGVDSSNSFRTRSVMLWAQRSAPQNGPEGR